MRGSRRRRRGLRNISTAMSVKSAQPEEFRDEELLADVICRLIGDARHIAVGNASPIPATAALLARESGASKPYVSLLGSAHTFFTTITGIVQVPPGQDVEGHKQRDARSPFHAECPSGQTGSRGRVGAGKDQRRSRMGSFARGEGCLGNWTVCSLNVSCPRTL